MYIQYTYNFCCFHFQFGKGVLEMARVFDRQVGMFFLIFKANFVVL